MAAATYEAALARVLKHEGGYSNHPSDPGGPTKFGITLANYARFKGRAVTAAEVRAMPLADARAIYKARYWNALRCDDLPAGFDYAVFDYGVNSGIGRAAKVMQRLLAVPVTGRVDDALVAAARASQPSTAIARMCDERLAFLKSLKTWPVFGAGWSRRVAEVRRDALAMAQGVPVDTPSTMMAAGKASVPSPTRARAVTAGGALAAGAGVAQAAHMSGASAAVALAILAGGVLAGIAGWAGWSLWHRRKQDAPAVVAAAGAQP